MLDYRCGVRTLGPTTPQPQCALGTFGEKNALNLKTSGAHSGTPDWIYKHAYNIILIILNSGCNTFVWKSRGVNIFWRQWYMVLCKATWDVLFKTLNSVTLFHSVTSVFIPQSEVRIIGLLSGALPWTLWRLPEEFRPPDIPRPGRSTPEHQRLSMCHWDGLPRGVWPAVPPQPSVLLHY